MLLAAALALTQSPFSVLVFSKTAGFRHDSIPTGIATIRTLGSQGNFKVEATEDAAAFASDTLKNYKVVVFLNTTGDVLNSDQESAFQSYIENGGGYVGIHAAADTEYDWPFYGQLVGAWFRSHPAIQSATIEVVDHNHPSTSHLSRAWVRTDEWYDYRAAPAPTVRILAKLDPDSYQGHVMGDDHPIAWCHSVEQGRSWYTGGGHTKETYAEPDFQKHLLGGILWASGY